MQAKDNYRVYEVRCRQFRPNPRAATLRFKRAHTHTELLLPERVRLTVCKLFDNFEISVNKTVSIYTSVI